MARRSPGPVFRGSLALLAGGTGFYVGCVAYRALSFAFFSSLTGGGIVMHVMGGDGRTLVGAGGLGERAFVATGWMEGAGAALGLGAALFTFLHARALATPRAAAPGLAALGLLALGALGADLRWGLTPWSEPRWLASGLVARGVPVEHELTVEEIQTLPDAISGSVARTEGVLEYSETMRRYHLMSLAERGRYVKASFYVRRRTGLSEMKGGGRPRYHELVEPFLGEHVVLVGRVVNGQIDVEISDLTLAP